MTATTYAADLTALLIVGSARLRERTPVLWTRWPAHRAQSRFRRADAEERAKPRHMRAVAGFVIGH